MATPPRYRSGDEIQVGDQIEHCGRPGVVVLVLERGEFAPDFPAEEWSYLEQGFIEEPDGTLFFYPEADECITLRSRAPRAGA